MLKKAPVALDRRFWRAANRSGRASVTPGPFMRKLCAFVTILVVRLACGNEGLGETSVVEKRYSPRVEKLRRQVEGLGVTLSWEGNQWVLCGRETERLGYSIKTEADALQFALDRARVRRVSRDGR